MSISLSGLFHRPSSPPSPAAPAQETSQTSPPPPAASEPTSPAAEEPGVQYVPASGGSEPVAYTPAQSVQASQSSATQNAASPTSPSATQRETSATAMTDRVAANRSGPLDRAPARADDGASSPRVAELMQAFLAQYGGNDRQVLDLI